MTFDEVMKVVLLHEGGFTNHPNDHGGPTNYGITQHDYAEFMGRPVTADEVKWMPLSSAIKIFKKRYWDQMNLDSLKSPKIQLCIMDWGVLHGTKSSVQLAQRTATALNRLLVIDGIMGPKTIDVLNSIDENAFCREFLQQVQMWMVRRCLQEKTQLVFLQGWLSRTHDLWDRVG
jgi:lysozyme family protein